MRDNGSDKGTTVSLNRNNPRVACHPRLNHAKWHDQQVQYIQDKTIDAFHKKYDYGLRSLVEAQISRIKRCIGATRLTQKLVSQKREGIVVANIINLWNAFGRPISVKKA